MSAKNSLKLAANAHENGWLEDDPFLWETLFSYVHFREGSLNFPICTCKLELEILKRKPNLPTSC